MRSTMKATWIAPHLTTHGSVEELTQQRAKEFGSGDGFVLIIAGQANPIKDIGS